MIEILYKMWKQHYIAACIFKASSNTNNILKYLNIIRMELALPILGPNSMPNIFLRISQYFSFPVRINNYL